MTNAAEAPSAAASLPVQTATFVARKSMAFVRVFVRMTLVALYCVVWDYKRN